MTVSSKTAQRYAKSLLEVAREREQVDRVLADIRLIHGTIEASRELFLFLRSPIIKHDRKHTVMLDLFSGKISDLTQMFLEVLIRKERERIIPEIAEAFLDLYDDWAGIQTVQVYAASGMDGVEKEDIRKILEEKTGKKIRMQFEVDESLKGGLMIRINDTIYDGSLKHKMEELRDTFLEFND